MNCPRTGKVCYASRAEATRRARELGTHGTGYRCHFCGQHHFTSQPKRVQRAIDLIIRSLP